VRAAKNQLYAVQAQADSAMSKAFSGYTPDMKEANSGAAYEQTQIAEARLAELKAGPTQEQLAQVQAAVDQARAALEFARKPFTDRDLKQAENAVAAAGQQLLLAQNPFTSQDLKAASAQVAQAQAAADAARAQAQDAILLAPMDGVVSERFLSPGAMAGPAAPILTLISVRTEVVFSVEEFRTGWVAAGQPVSIFVSAYPDQAFSGLVSVVAPSLDPRSRTFTVKVEPEDPKGKLKPGMSARIELAQEGGEKRGLWVPAEAVIKQEDGAFVFTVAAGKARKQKVEVGATEGGETVILAGLSNGDRVIVSGQASVKDGEPVRVQG
ncbi:MAG: efflux RND transporter periplasmic adaptor subunit, partial [Chloroflexota bacterium]|nr:efflux RND transporter periplasmic adaptor subunit [Chloroflexota bacterium]